MNHPARTGKAVTGTSSLRFAGASPRFSPVFACHAGRETVTATRWLYRLSGKYSPIGARGRAFAMSVALLLLAVCSVGCVGYRNHYDLDADKYDAARLTAVLDLHLGGR